MEQHYGQLVEKVIRRNGYCISELARLSNVNRRSVYNWFNQRNLKSEIIYRIGCALNHDFSVEFPDLFDSTEFSKRKKSNFTTDTVSEKSYDEASNDNIWKDKYLLLLEKYIELLNQNNEGNIRNFVEADCKKCSA